MVEESYLKDGSVGLLNVTSQKTLLFIVTALSMSDFTCCYLKCGLSGLSSQNARWSYVWCFWGVKQRPVRRADNFTAICEPIV
jgi:hypothetical protein